MKHRSIHDLEPRGKRPVLGSCRQTPSPDAMRVAAVARGALRRLSVVALLAASALLPAPLARAASIRAELHPAEIPLGEQAQLSVTIVGSQNAPAPRLPAIAGLRVRGLGQTMSMQIVGGEIRSEVTHNFLLEAERAGNFRIPPLTVTTASGILETEPLVLRVVPAGQAPRAAPPPRTVPGAGPRRPPAGVETPPLRLTISGLPERDLWVGELLPVQLQLDVRGDVQVTQVSSPELAGHVFSLAQPREQQEPPQRTITIGDVRYTRFSLPAAISPVTAGTHDLSVSLTATAILPRGRPARRSLFDDPFFDSFFGGTRERREVSVESPARKVVVRPLPEVGKPADFSGGIGRFTLSAKATPTELTVGDPLTLELRVSGKGNFDRLALPPLASGTEWKTYPQTTASESRDGLGHSGTKTFSQVLIPERVDIDAVPARELSYFDPDRGRYERARSEPIALVVRPAALGPATARARSAAEPRDGATGDETGAFEIAPNQIELGRLRDSLRPLALDPRFLALQFVPLALLLAGFALARRREHLAGDASHQRAVAASRAVREALAEADRAVKRADAPAFFAAARRALQERVAAPGRNAASLAPEEVEACVPPDSPLGATVRAIFESADRVAYSGERPRAEALREWRDRLRAAVRDLPAGGSR